MDMCHEMSARYKYARCHHRQYYTREIRAAGWFWSKVFDVEGRRFATVACQRCKHTELFRIDSSKLGPVFDLFTG